MICIFSSMNGNCYVCGQTRPCCRQTLFELFDNRHHNAVLPLRGEIKRAWGLGSVWKTCCGTIYGMYFNEKTIDMIQCIKEKRRSGSESNEFCKIIHRMKNGHSGQQDSVHVPVVKKFNVILKNIWNSYLWSSFSVALMSSRGYYKDLKPSDFTSDVEYLEERVKWGLQAGYTFQDCFNHWIDDFGQTLQNASSQNQMKDNNKWNKDPANHCLQNRIGSPQHSEDALILFMQK